MRLVVLESPYAGEVNANVAYAKDCLADCFSRNEAPFAAHLLYPPIAYAVAMDAALAWAQHASATVVYVDHGVTPGMRLGVEAAQRAGRLVEYRKLEPWCAGGPELAGA